MIARTVIIFVQAAGTAIYYRLIPGLVQRVIRAMAADPVRNLSCRESSPKNIARIRLAEAHVEPGMTAERAFVRKGHSFNLPYP